MNILPDGEGSHQLRQVLRMHGLELGKDVIIALVTKSNAEEIWEILEKAGFLANDVDRENYDKVMEGQWYRLSPDGSFPLDGVEQVIKEQKEAGNISDAVTIDRVIRLEPLHDAQRELGIQQVSGN